MPDFVAEFEQRGFRLIPKIASEDELDRLKVALAQSDIARVERGGETYGGRNLLHLAEVRAIATAPKIASYLQTLLGPAFLAVRGLFFDKTQKANWPVPWHQDLSLAVQERRDLAGWTNWTVKRGVSHVQPPSDVLSRMVTMRLHLDDCPAENGPLRLIPESHRKDILDREQIAAQAQREPQTIIASMGDALLMRPLILHSSSPARVPHHRRVLHLEFASSDLLPSGLHWAEI